MAERLKMKKLISGCLCLLLATLFLSVIPTDAECALFDDTIRLHILANSDTSDDQALKIKVRDGILNEFSEKLNSIDSKEAAETELHSLLSEIETLSEKIITDEGYNYPVKVTLSEEWYETREYDSFTLPRGIYTSLRVIIGEGEGKNCWCVMFPPLCLDMATEPAPCDDAIKKYSNEEISLISGGRYNVKFKLLEMISSAFS